VIVRACNRERLQVGKEFKIGISDKMKPEKSSKNKEGTEGRFKDMEGRGNSGKKIIRRRV